MLLERFLLLWLTALSLVAYWWPAPFEFTQPFLDYLFALTMFAIGWMLPRDEVQQVARRWPTVLGGTALQYASMPLLAYGLGRLFGLEGPMLVGIVVVGCVPGAMASNVLTLAARGNVSYSVSLTTSATLLSPLIVPWTLSWFLRREVEINPLDEALRLGWIVVAPVVAGHLLARQYAQWQHAARRIGSVVANLTILWIIAVVVAVHREKVADIQLPVLSALSCLNLLGYTAGLLGGLALRLPPSMRRALTLEIGMQNAGLGVVLATQSPALKDLSGAAIPPALYTFGCMFTGAVLARCWAAGPAKDDGAGQGGAGQGGADDEHPVHTQASEPS